MSKYQNTSNLDVHFASGSFRMRVRWGRRAGYAQLLACHDIGAVHTWNKAEINTLQGAWTKLKATDDVFVVIQ